MTPDDLLFGRLAIKLGFITQAQISECIAYQRNQPGQRLGQICFDKGYLARDQVEVIVRHQIAMRRQQQAPPTASGTPPQAPAAPPVTPSSPPAPDVTASEEVGAAASRAPSAFKAQPIVVDRLSPDPTLLKILREAQQRSASDVHVMAGAALAYRFAGQLLREGEPLPADHVEQMLYSVMSEARREQLSQFGYSDFALHLNQVGRFRVNVGRHATGLKGCFRILLDRPATLEKLGLPADQIAKVCQYHQGLAIVSGPNGQGKTTTMAAIVDILNATKPYHIISVEDPVEILYPMARAVVSQREVGVHTKSFARALKGALREDPDVIVIGELRDVETVEIALEAAETGHLVVATMSTRSGSKTIDRLIDMFPPAKQGPVRHTLAGALKIIVSQRLLPSADGQSMVAAAEVISGNVQLWNLIRDNKLIQLPSLMQRGESMGMLRFDESLRMLVEAGRITSEVALEFADDKNQLRERLAGGLGRPAAAAAEASGQANDPSVQPTPSSDSPSRESRSGSARKEPASRIPSIGGLFRKRR